MARNRIEHQLEPFSAMARWIPLAIEPFAPIRDIILVGMQGCREHMNK